MTSTEEEIAHFEQMVSEFVTFIEGNVSADSAGTISEVRQRARRIRLAGFQQANVSENLTRIEGDIEVLCSPRKWQKMGWDWHKAHLNNAIAGLEMATDRLVDALRKDLTSPARPS